MTMDKSLRVRKGSSSARGVLSRGERILKLKEQERWEDGRSPLGLPGEECGGACCRGARGPAAG